jgi:hypothetical protein
MVLEDRLCFSGVSDPCQSHVFPQGDNSTIMSSVNEAIEAISRETQEID